MRLSLLISLLLIPALCFGGASGKVKSGNKQYKKGMYSESLQHYREAQIANPTEHVINYDIGNALYKTGDYEGAENEFNKATASKNKNVKQRAFYNLGNNAFKKQETDKALENYKKALMLNPNDEDAKYNYEYLLRQKANPQKNKGKGKNDKNKDDKNKNKDKSDNNKDKQDKEQQKQADKNKMSKDDAQRMLQYFDESDRNSAKKRKMQMPQPPKTEEDW